jgi:hypothetical protein
VLPKKRKKKRKEGDKPGNIYYCGVKAKQRKEHFTGSPKTSSF